MKSRFIIFFLTFSSLLLALITLYHATSSGGAPRAMGTRVALYVMTVPYIITALFALIPWYGWEYAGRGIDGHFRLIFWMTSAITTPFLALSCFGYDFPVMQSLIALLLLLVCPIHFTLLRYRFRDKDPLPPGYFSRGDDA